jgi:mannose-6-phosphate isomerase-like protein (cupin superfamily)
VTAASGTPEPDAIAPDGSLIYFRVGDAEHASLVEVVLPAGAASRPVRHLTVEEIWYVLAGAGEVWLKEPSSGIAATHPLASRATIVIPTGHHFQFRSAGPGELRFLCYTSPPWPGPGEAVAVESGAWPPTMGPTAAP